MENKVREMIIQLLPEPFRKVAEFMTLEEVIHLFYEIYSDILNGDERNDDKDGK